MSHAPHPRAVSLLALLLLAAAAACGGSEAGHSEREMREESAAGSADAVATMPVEAPAPPPSGGRAQGLDRGMAAAADTASGGQAQPSGPALPAMIIRTGEATVKVDSLEPAVARVQALAKRLGGFVGSTSVTGGEHQVRNARLEVKVPAERFDQAVGGLRPLGEVESVMTTAQDVGEEFVDVTARMTNARRLEERLLALLANRTGRLEDVLAVERELARVREEIERYEGRLRYLRSRVSLSTLVVNLHEPFPVVGDYPGSSPIAQAFRQAWRNFVSFVATLIASLGILVPLALVLFVALWLLRWAWRLFRRGSARRKETHEPPPPAP